MQNVWFITTLSHFPLDPCFLEKCNYFGACLANPDGTTQCTCRKECTPAQKSGFVCGSDDKIYENECALRKYVCAKKLNVTVKNYGVCCKCCRKTKAKGQINLVDTFSIVCLKSEH